MKAVVITRKASKQELKQAFKAQPEAIVDHEYQNRSIAKMLSSALQVEGEDFKEHVESYLLEINKLPADARRALKYAFIFSRKAPHQEREDLYQELAIKLLELRAHDDKIAYAVARCDWKDWWKAFKLRVNYNWQSIERMADAEDGGGYGQEAIDRQIYHSALLQGEVEFERKVDIDILWNKLPERIQAIISKQIAGYCPTGAERVALCNYLKAHSTMLAEFK